MAVTNHYGSIAESADQSQSSAGSGQQGAAPADLTEPSINGGHKAAVTPSDTQTLNKATDDELTCLGFRDSVLLLVVYWTLVVMTAGLLLLVTYWKPVWRLKMTKRSCLLKYADTVMLQDLFGNTHIESVVMVTLTDGPVEDSCSVVQVYTVEPGSVPNNFPSYDSLDRLAGSKTTGEFTYIDADSDQSTGGQVDMDDTTTLTVRARVCLRYFEHKHVRYMWDNAGHSFMPLEGVEGVTCGRIHDMTGLTDDEQAHKLQIYGKNFIDVEVKSYTRLFFQEVLNPFYIFQICSVVLWSLDNYYIYASCIVLISAVSLGVELYETRKQMTTLREMVLTDATTITVLRAGGVSVEVPTDALAPGDVIVVPARGCVMACDAVLVSGNAIVNESMLTGESVPVTKTHLSPSEADELYTPDTHKRHTLFCGTHVIQTRYYGDSKVKAVVVRTGFYTAKGGLVRSILYPKPMGFKFYKDSMKFIGFLGCIAACGMGYSIVILIRNGESAGKVVLRALDIITIVVPPALPAAMTVGTAYAQSRLKKAGIFCISPPRINIAGKLKLIVFDKTGTLTEDGLDLWGVVDINDGKLGSPTLNPTELPARSPLVIAMATCHSLTIIDNELCGDPLDLKMFQSINWIIDEPGRDTTKFDSLMPTVVKPIHKSYNPTTEDETPYEVGIVRQFTFSSSLQRMSVLVRVLGAENMDVYVKGAPEKIYSLCRKETVPSDFINGLQKYTKKGYRVIAIAYKPLDSKVTWHHAQRLSRDQLECDLTFLGLLIMENMLKPETSAVITRLGGADIRTVMATGDNILTAMSVAHQCGMIPPREPIVLVDAQPPEGMSPARVSWELAALDNGEVTEDTEADITDNFMTLDTQVIVNSESSAHMAVTMGDGDPQNYHFALSGRSFTIIRQYFPELLHKICVRGTVFARMSPDQKAQLVEILMDLGYCVGMCGDGANDCGALKTAHVGISLSETEASVASPFTSKTPNIECVPTLIREGRAALVTSFGVFKYMALYSIVQFVSVLILYTMRTNLSDWMFLYIDLVITTTVAFLMGHTAAYPHLVAKRPPGSLVGAGNIVSILVHIAIVCGFQTAAYLYLAMQPWYTKNPGSGDTDINRTMETTTIFYISAFQYLMLAFIFSKGPPYRKPIWTNVPFLVALILLFSLTSYILLYPPGFITSLLQLVPMPSIIFLLTLLGIAACNFCLAVILESFIIPSSAFNRCMNTLRRKKTPKNKYKVVQSELRSESHWPPIGGITLATRNMAATGVDLR